MAGDYHALHAWSDAYLAFLRHDAATGQTCLVVLNFSDTTQAVPFDLGGKQVRLLFAGPAHGDQPLTLDPLTFAPFEVFVAELV